MSAAMSSLILVTFCNFLIVSAGKYKPVGIEIKTNPGGEPLKIFTAKELSKYDGSDPELPIYMGIRGVVFDVTAGKDFYSKGSSYNKLVGKDASRAHALWSLEDKDLTHDVSGLTDQQLEGLDEVYQKTYLVKYPIVGYMDWFMSENGDGIKNRFSNDEL